MKKIVIILLGVVIAFFIFRFFLIRTKDYTNANKCNSSKFVADGGRVYLQFVNVSETKKVYPFSIILKRKDGTIVKLKYVKTNSLTSTYYIDYKILKSDTIMMKGIKNKEIKIYDFKNDAQRVNAGQQKGGYYCFLHYEIDGSKEESDFTNYIYIYL